MESGRFLLAVVLMIAVVVITNILIPPVVDPSGSLATDSTLAAPAAPGVTPEPATAAPMPAVVSAVDPGAVPVTASSPADTIMVTSDLFRLGVSDHGGDLVSAELLQYESFEPETERHPVQLQPEFGGGLIRHRIRLGERVVDLAQLAFRASASSVDVQPDGGPERLTLNFADTAGSLAVELTYEFAPDSYIINVSGRVTGAGTTPQLLIDLGPTLRSNEAVASEDHAALAFTVNSTETGIKSTTLGKVKEQAIASGPLRWIALKNKYFLLAAMESADRPMPFGGLISRPRTEPFSADLTANLLANDAGEFAYRLYIGPQQADRLSAIGNQLQDVSIFGWKFLQPVLRPLGHAITWALLGTHQVLGIGYGWVLILFGFLIRFILWPLNSKAMRSQMKNMEIQPRIKEIQARYKSDPQKLQQEMLKLYKEEGFNPMGGCLPMLLPLPVLITLFFVFRSTIEVRGVPFLWLPDLALKDPLYILPIALGLSMFAQQMLNMKTTKDAPAQMKYMTYIMPVFLTFLFLNFASGLNLYYASMNIASLPQQLQIMKERQRRTVMMSGGTSGSS